jgi:hypothetical protein
MKTKILAFILRPWTLALRFLKKKFGLEPSKKEAPTGKMTRPPFL